MKKSQFQAITDTQLDICKAVLEAKGYEYADDHDVLSNFRAAASLQHISLREALSGMMAKHTVSLYEMLGNPERTDAVVWNEKITDHINYLLILKAIVVEELPADEADSAHEPLPFADADLAKFRETPLFTQTGTSPTDLPRISTSPTQEFSRYHTEG